MTFTLSGGFVVGPGECVLAPNPGDRPENLPPGSPVAVGPATAGEPERDRARAELRALIAAAGPLAAGAGAALTPGPANHDADAGGLEQLRPGGRHDTGGSRTGGSRTGGSRTGGFRSARWEGGAGNRRDAVLAVLAAPRFAERVGPPAALLVALFGADATRPLASRTLRAIEAGDWPQLRYAVAASDLLGPEQLVELLGLTAPPGVDPLPDGLASTLGEHLARFLVPMSRRRRVTILTQLWERTCAAGTAALRVRRLRQSQADLSEGLLARRKRYDRDEIERAVSKNSAPSLARAALWYPPDEFWSRRLDRMLADVLAATVLARVAVTAVDEGPLGAVHRHRQELVAAASLMTGREAGRSTRPVAGELALPARPGVYLRDLAAAAENGGNPEPIRRRLACARGYGLAAWEFARALLREMDLVPQPNAAERYQSFQNRDLREWRAKVGYFSPERIADWPHTPEPLPTRCPPGTPPENAERLGDLLWLAELADALARLHGHPAAAIVHEDGSEFLADLDPAPAEPRHDATITQAAAHAAQLVELGAKVPAKPRSWPELLTSLTAVMAAAERFEVPDPVAATDGTPLGEARVEVARSGDRLAEWAAYMGNCIADEHYVEDAKRGRIALVALRAPDGRILANVELRPAAAGWSLGEFRGRFNADPDPALALEVRRWVHALGPQPGSDPDDQERREPPRDAEQSSRGVGQFSRRAGQPSPHVRHSSRDARHSSRDARQSSRGAGHQSRGAGHQSRGAGQPSRGAGHRSLPAIEQLDLGEIPVRPQAVLTALIGAPPTTESLVALRRLPQPALTEAVAAALADPTTAGRLWVATADRPLTAAIDRQPDSVREKLSPLLSDPLLPRSLRHLTRLPTIAPARTADVVALRVRRSLAELLKADSPALSTAMSTHPHGPLLRAAALAVTSWNGLPAAAPTAVVSSRRRIRVPGYPQTTLRDDLWQHSWPDARDLDARPDTFWQVIATRGLLLPASWLTSDRPADYRPSTGWQRSDRQLRDRQSRDRQTTGWQCSDRPADDRLTIDWQRSDRQASDRQANARQADARQADARQADGRQRNDWSADGDLGREDLGGRVGVDVRAGRSSGWLSLWSRSFRQTG